MVKVVYRNQSDSHCNQSDTQPSILVTTARALLVTTLLPSLTRTHHITLSVLEGWWWGGGGDQNKITAGTSERLLIFSSSSIYIYADLNQ